MSAADMQCGISVACKQCGELHDICGVKDNRDTARSTFKDCQPFMQFYLEKNRCDLNNSKHSKHCQPNNFKIAVVQFDASPEDTGGIIFSQDPSSAMSTDATTVGQRVQNGNKIDNI